MADQVPIIAAAEILRLLIGKGYITDGDAAACLRGISNQVTACGYRSGLGGAGRPYATYLRAEADRFGTGADPFANND